MCDEVCDSRNCGYDGGDCSSTVEVASGNNCSSIVQAIQRGEESDLKILIHSGDYSLLKSNPEIALTITKSVEIDSISCTIFNQNRTCSQSFATIFLTSDPVSIEVFGNFAIKNIEFKGGFPLVSACTDPHCNYCPNAYHNTTSGMWLSDQSNNLSNFAPQAACDYYNDTVLFKVHPEAELSLINVTFHAITHQLLAVIQSECGGIYLENVTFSDITVRRNGGISGVIVLNSTAATTCGSVTYAGGLVELLNNGFEFSDGDPFSGFAVWQKATFVEIRDVTFRSNMILSNTTQPVSLISIERVTEIRVLRCDFVRNLAVSAVIMIQVEKEPSFSIVEIADSNFESNLGIVSSAIRLYGSRSPSQISITNCSFYGNYAQTDGILCITMDSPSQDYLTSTENTFKGQISLKEIKAEENFASFLIHFHSFYEVDIESLTSSENGDYPKALQRVFQEYMNNSKVYISRIPTLIPSVCTGTLFLGDITRISLHNANFTACHCSFGSPGLTHTGFSTNISIANLRFVDNQGEELLALTLSFSLVLSQLHFENNTNMRTNQAVCLRFAPLTSLSIAILDSEFVSNRGFQNTIASVSGVQNFSMIRVTALRNQAVRSSAGVVFYPYTKSHSFLQVSDSRFEGNTAFSNGVISIIDSIGEVFSGDLRTNLQIFNTLFVGNFANFTGSCVTISGFIQLDSKSEISSSVFERNSCKSGGAAIYTQNFQQSLLPTYSKGQLRLSGSIFTSNFGDSIVAIIAPSFVFDTASCLFVNSLGVSVQLTHGLWNDSRSTFRNNAGSNAGAALLSEETHFQAVETTFVGNTANHHGGAISAWLNTTIACLHCLFESNTCKYHGGAIDLEERSKFLGNGVVFRNNTAREQGAALYSISSLTLCEECIFEYNHAKSYSCMFIMGSQGSLKNSIIRRNTADVSTPGFMLSQASLTLINCTFLDQVGNVGAFVSVTDQSELIISDSFFAGGRAELSGGCFYSSVNSTITINDTEITNSSAKVFGNVVMMRTGSLQMTRVDIHHILSDQSVGSIVVTEGSVELEAQCWDLQGSAVIASFSTVEISRSGFTDMVAYYGAAVSCTECSLLTVHDSHFENGLAKKGGAVYQFSSGSYGIDLTTIFKNCSFIHNRAVNGGAVYSESVFVYMSDCLFLNNSVSPDYYDSVEILNRGIGAALYCVNANIVVSIYKIVNNRFVNNTASNMGAALYWFDTYPIFESNVFIGNTAPYGAESASFPIRLSLLNEHHELTEYLTTESVPLVLKLLDIASGQVSNIDILLALVDQYDCIVTADSHSSAQLQVVNSDLSGLSGRVQVDANIGVFQFSNITFIGKPKSTQNFTIHSQGVNTYLKKFTSDPHKYFSTVRIEVEFRDCNPGESYQGLSCYLCTAGTFSLEPSQPCNSCPANAICYGGYRMVPRRGYWRPDPSLNLFIECNNKEACIGSPENGNYSLMGNCADGYSGNLCSVCKIGHSRSGKDTCKKCPSLYANIILCCLMLVIGLCLLALAVFLAIRGARRPRSKIAIYVKVFLNYLQMVIVAASLNLSWPDFVKLFLDGQEAMGSVADQLFSFECVLQQFELSNVYYARVVILVLPAGLISLSVICWVVLACCKPVFFVSDKIIASVVVVLFVLHPSLTKSLFSSFACLELRPTEFWLTYDLSQRCWDRSHAQQLLTMTVPGLIVWCFGLPTVCLLFLVKSRKNLSNSIISLRFSFLYKGYKPELFYWEFVVLYRKLAVLCSSVFFSTVSTLTQALSVLAVLLVYLFLQVRISPFSLQAYNSLEIKSILVSLITIYSGLYFEANRISNPHSDFQLSVILFAVILLANAYFLVSWIRNVIPIIIETIKQSLDRITHFGSANENSEDPPSSAQFSRVTHSKVAVHPDQISIHEDNNHAESRSS